MFVSKPAVPRNPDFEHLRQSPDGMCWWCGAVATTSEHKYKRSDLELMGGNGELYWGGDPDRPYIVKSIRRDPAVRFVKSFCADCNNARSQPFDRAYDLYRDYIWDHLDELWGQDGLDMQAIYGDGWVHEQANLARYFVKHFGCRLVDEGLRPPRQMADFLSGADSMPNVHLAFVARRDFWMFCARMRSDGFPGRSLWLDPVFTNAPEDRSALHDVITASYVSYIGVRFHWNMRDQIRVSSFFPHPLPLLNYFDNEDQAHIPPGPAGP
jgi:hypothetical protein